MSINDVKLAFRRQAEACDMLGSPFTARLSRLLGERLETGDSVGGRVFGWPGDPSPAADSVPLRLAGSLHALVLAGRDEPLAAAYPPHAADDEQLWRAVSAALRTHSDFILERLKSPPQTNEVRRSAALLPGFLTIAAMFGKPLVLSEVGASAGLNLQWDRYRYRLGETIWGDASSPVAIEPDWQGPPSPTARIAIAGRAGCDLSPVDAADPMHRLRMLSYVWADQADRLARTRAALDIAASAGLKVERADAIDWLRRRLAERHVGQTHVVFHTIAWQYFPTSLQAEGEALLAEAGARATGHAPLARLALEADGNKDGASLTLQVWPGGDKKEIGRADFHGRWIRWQGWE